MNSEEIAQKIYDEAYESDYYEGMILNLYKVEEIVEKALKEVSDKGYLKGYQMGLLKGYKNGLEQNE